MTMRTRIAFTLRRIADRLQPSATTNPAQRPHHHAHIPAHDQETALIEAYRQCDPIQKQLIQTHMSLACALQEIEECAGKTKRDHKITDDEPSIFLRQQAD